MNDILKVTIIQTSLKWEAIEENLEKFENKIKCIDNKTDIIVLPEMFSTGFSMNPAKLAQQMEGEAVFWMKEMAKQCNAVIIGSLIIEENLKYFNRLLVVFPDGLIQYYDKKHLFAMAGENSAYSAGNEKLIFNYKGWKICPLICYDLRFPVWIRNKNDYEVLIFVANWPEKRSNHWKILLQARAIENQSYVVGVNRIGEDGNKYIYSGDSCVIDPMGKKISTTEAYKENIETIALSHEQLINTRKLLPFYLDSDQFHID
jgi:omega-amidase